MQLFLFSDLHCNLDRARHVERMAADADIVVGAGDFGICRGQIVECIRALKSIDRPAILVPGNAESYEELLQACSGWKMAHVLHGSGTTVNGVDFFGIGGGIPVTPFGSWSYDFTEAEAEKLLEACPADGVLVSHSPPKGAVDVSSSGANLGSAAVRAAVERCRPKLVVCGHIHESGGKQEMIGETVVINAGPEGMVWELGRIKK